MLDIATFDAARGSGSVLYKALAHPLSAEAIRDLYGRLAAAGGGVAVYDPVGAAGPLALLHPMGALPLASVYVQDVREVSARRLGRVARPVTELPRSGARAVLVAAYDAGRLAAQAAPWMPPGAVVATLDDAALPPVLRTNPRRVLDPLNFATNLTFFRDADGLSTRLVTANYWTGYGARGVRLWLRLFDAEGRALATWEEALPEDPGGVAIDSREVRARFGLPEFVGHLFVHVVGAAGHDTVKYVLHVLSRDGGGPTLSCTHDANPWPADRYAGIPAPRPDERVVVWLENAHPVPIPAGAVGLARMGAGEPVPLREAVPPFGMAAMDVGTLLPGVAWPAQLELFAGRHVVRPRYEVLRGGRRRIAHANVERTDLTPDPAIPGLELLGRGFLLPFPVLDRERFRTIVQPTPMATGQADLPLAIEVFAPDGRRLARRFLGRLPRDHALALDLDDLLDEAALRGAGGHAELLYDFREGGGADGWLHAIFRYEDRRTGHAAECSFGSHVYNTILTYKGEPQSYAGPPPGLSTRLFLGLGHAGRCSFAVLIHPISVPRAAASDTQLLLHDGAGAVLAEARLSVPPSGSVVVWPDRVFAAEELSRAGERGYVLVRDGTCRLFGFHGLVDDDPAARGGFSLDHMFGF